MSSGLSLDQALTQYTQERKHFKRPDPDYNGRIQAIFDAQKLKAKEEANSLVDKVYQENSLNKTDNLFAEFFTEE